MNRYAKMRRVNAKLRKEWESKGWIVHFEPHTRFHKDMFNLFDGVLLRPIDEPHFFQVKSNAWPKLKLYQDFVKKWNCTALLVRHRDRKGFDFKVIE